VEKKLFQTFFWCQWGLDKMHKNLKTLLLANLPLFILLAKNILRAFGYFGNKTGRVGRC